MAHNVNRREIIKGIGATSLFTTVQTTGTAAAETDELIELTRQPATNKFSTAQSPELTVADTLPLEPGESSPINDQVVPTETQLAATIEQPASGAVSSGGSLIVWAGVVDTDANGIPFGVEDQEIDFTIDRPDGESNQATQLTDDDGSAIFSYDVPETVVGEYEITISYSPDEGQSESLSEYFDVGPVLESTTQQNRGRPVLTGSNRDFRFLLRDGQSPISGQSVTITTERNGTEIGQTTVQTDSDGFATISDTPAEVGETTLRASTTVDGRDLSAIISYPVSEIGYEYDFFDLDPILAGSQTSQGGRLWTGQGEPLSNTEIEVSYTNEENNINIVNTTTTDRYGFFAVDFDVPTGIDRLATTIQTTDGRTAALGTFEEDVSVRAPEDDDGGDDPTATVSVEFDEFRIAPGITTSLSITATEADGTPISDETAHLIGRYDYGGDGAPIITRSITTGEDGTATVDLNIPEQAVSNTWLNITAVINRDDNLLTGDDSEFIESLNENVEIEVDSQLNVTFEATEIPTENPLADVSTHTDIQYISGRTGSITGEYLVTDDDGKTSTSTTKPGDLSYLIGGNHLSVGQSESTFSVYVAPYPGRLQSEVNQEPVEPGTEVPLEYEIAAESASGLLYGSVGDIPVATTFDTETDELSVTVPENAGGGSMSINVWAVGSNGDLFAGTEYFEVGQGGGGGQEDGVRMAFEPTNGEIDVDTDLTYDLTVEGPTNGVSAYEFTAELGDIGVATISDAELVAFGGDSANVDVAEDGSSVFFGETVGDADPPGDPFTIARVTIAAGDTEGTTELSIGNDATIQDNDGTAYEFDELGTATVAVVEEVAPDVTGNGDPAQDLDGDGLYEDVDGNGEADIFDVQALYENQDAAAVQNNAGLFNFDGENGIDVFDVQSLFERI